MITIFRSLTGRIESAEAYCQSHFYKSQWQESNTLLLRYLIYRWIIAITFLVLLIGALLDMGKTTMDYAKFFIYLTHWGFILCTIQAIMAAFLVTFKLRELKDIKTEAEREQILSKPSLLAEIYCILFTMSVVCAFGITVIFWTRVYVPNYHHLNAMMFVLHGLNAVLMLMDVLIVAHPLKFMHFTWTFAFVFTYLSFSYIYYLAGGTNSKNNTFIYHALNWDDPAHALRFCVTSLLFGFVLHVCMWTFSVMVRRISGVSNEKETGHLTIDTSAPSHSHQNCVVVTTRVS